MSVRYRAAALFIVTLLALWGPPLARAEGPVQTTLNDFHMPGTQAGALGPESGNDPIVTADACFYCHRQPEGDTEAVHIFRDWSGSMMAQAARDPLFYACLQVANNDAIDVGDMCLRCHSPKAWLEGRSTPTDGSALTDEDRQGVSCNFCHRMVALQAAPDECDMPDSSCRDADIRQDLLEDGDLPGSPGNGGYVVDPADVRRGPFFDAVCDLYHGAEPRVFYSDAAHCGTCHDVSNPVYTRSGDDYLLGDLDVPHPTGDKYDMFPIERTYSEWLMSDFNSPEGIDMGGRFGGNDPVVSTCQTCHMPRGLGDGQALRGCWFSSAPLRIDQPMHYFHGANAWIPEVLINLYPDEVDEDALLDNKARNIAMLQAAATLEVSLESDAQFKVRVTNETGHKLPSGYPEGRRMWVHVVFRDCQGSVLAEHGHYDSDAAVLTTSDTKVYEAQFGIDAAVSELTGLPEGPGFHFALANKIYLDNRIPPRGFSNEEFETVQAEPVGYSYEDGQYWDDTYFDVPAFAATAEVELHYQTSSKEYVEFLKDNNPLPPDDPDNMGELVYDQWLVTGKSAPVQMAGAMLDVLIRGDMNGDRMLSDSDVPGFVDVLLGATADPLLLCAADMNASGVADGDDISAFVAAILQ